jgi:hypothetical protein
LQASTEASKLWPYLLPYVEKVASRAASSVIIAGGGSSGGGGSVAAHALSGASHTGNLADTQAPQFLKLDGTRALTGDLPVDAGVTIDGVDISAHVADPDAHHHHATAANTAIGVDSSQGISVALRTSSGLLVSTGLGVDKAADFVWTGTHQFNETPQIDANLNFIGADRVITSGTGDDLTIDLGAGADLILASDMTFRSADFVDGIPIAGFSFFLNPGLDRQLTINTIKSDSLHTRVFVADMVRIDMGEEYWGKSMGILYQDWTSPSAIGNSNTIYFEDAPLISGAVFESGDWILIRYINRGAGLDYGSIWGQVTGYTDLGADSEGRKHQSWLFTLRHGDTSTKVKKGNLAVDFGVAGQGYVHLSTLDDADGPWIRIGDWSGANPYTAGNTHVRTQMGRLDGISDAALNPAGWGFYSDNAFLRGAVRTAETMMDDDGLSFQIQTDTSGGHFGFSRMAWWRDLGDRSGLPITQITSSTDYITTPSYNVWELIVTNEDVDVAHITLSAAGTSGGHTGVILLEGGVTSSISIDADVITATDLEPFADLAYDLGSASKRWRTVYANQLVISGFVSGGSLGGQTWTYPGSMIIDANSTADTTVSVTNGSLGRADLAVDRDITLGGNIIVGGNVDGIDVSAFKTVYDLHAANPNAHHSQSHVLATGTGLGPDHTISGAAAGQVLRALSATTAAFDQLQHGDLDPASITPNQHHNQSHVLATGTGLGPDHTISGAAAGQVLRALSATTAAFDQLGHNDLDPASITPNQHHSQSHILATGTGLGADHTISGAAAGQVLRALSATTAAFDQLSHNDLDPASITANQHHNQVHGIVSSDHTGVGAAMSVIGFSATNVLGVLVPSSDVGTTPAAAILKSTTAGGLILGTLTVDGETKVVNGGDFTVGANVLFVDNSLASVGINRAPDSQFDLDIAGAMRADLIVGKHAIQLKNVLLLSHFDGGDPYASNMTGETSGHMGQVGTLLGGAIFRPGHFYKALQCAPSKTNLCLNPSFEVDLSNWSVVNGGTWTRVTTDAYAGVACVKGVTTSSSHSLCSNTLTGLTPGAIYVVSCWIRRETLAGTSRIFASNSTFGNQTYSNNVTADMDWTRAVLTYVVDSTGTLRVGFTNTTNGTAYYDAVQIEASWLSPYLDGSLSDDPGLPAGGHSWSGTAHNSTSSRTFGKLTYPVAGNLNAERGTIMAWIYSEADSGTTGQGILDAGAAWPNFGFYVTNVGRAQGIWGTGSNAAFAPNVSVFGGWHHVAFTWSIYTQEAVCYLDGVPGTVNTAFTATAPVLGSTITVGQLGTLGSGFNFNGYIDDLVILDHVMTPTEILAVFESDAPVFAESSVFTFRVTPKGLVWADEEGLWMHDTDGNAVLGAFGGDAASKSWGGFIMGQGDIAFGQFGASNGGWFYFDRDGVSSKPFLKLGWGSSTVLALDSGGASLTGVLDIDTSGGIYQGSGTFAVPTTGLKLYNVSGTGKLSGYNGGVEQVKIDTDGRLYAGAGSVKLDALGLSLNGLTAGAIDPTPGVSGVRWLTGGVEMGSVSMQQVGTENTFVATARATASHNATLHLSTRDLSDNLTSYLSMGLAGQISLVGTGVMDIDIGTHQLTLTAGSAFMPRLIVFQDNAVAAQPVISLQQTDTSEEFIDFIGNSSTVATTPISTQALGTYYGKVRVAVNGVFKWLPVYN